jgi:acyl-homoserine-lactone acylase
MKSRSIRVLGPAAAAALGLLACDGDPRPAASIELRYTEFGIPHILSDSYEHVAFGQGYAQARDNACEIELGMLGFAGQLSRHFGPAAEGSSMASVTNSLDSDVYFTNINQSGAIERLLELPPPLGPRAEVRELVHGFAAGFNRYLEESPELSCGGAEWLRPMTEIDVYRRAYAVTLLMGQAGYFGGGIVSAQPPLASSSGSDGVQAVLAAAPVLSPRLPGSNAIALGADATQTGGGMNVANPHLWWHGDMRWWQAQLTVPGKLDVSGAGLIGLPLVVMGHTASAAWSITTAEQSWRETAFELSLVDGDPTSYWVDGVAERMQRRDIRVEVKQPDGSLETVTRALWWTRYGPVVGAGSGIPLPPWSAGGGGEPGRAYVLADPNTENLRMLNTLFAFDHAQSSADVLRAVRETQGVPWWSVLAADADGHALWSQIQVLANVPDAHAERCSTDFGQAFFAASRIPVLDGSRSECAWQVSPDALQPGTFAPDSLPFAESDRYLENSNGSHWLPSADVQITGMPRLLGDEGSERSLRTRGLIAELEATLASAPLSRQALSELVLSNRSYSADLVVEGTLALCRPPQAATASATSGEAVDLREACQVLSRWDHQMDTDSPGALLFSRYWTRAMESSRRLEASPWRVPFDPRDPVHTPHTLDVSAPFIGSALADAVLELQAAGVPLDASLGDYQYVTRGGRRWPIGGGTDDLAVVNAMTTSFEPAGSPERFYGSTYLHVVALDGSPCPDAVTLLGYSQSSEPGSPHHTDQTELFSRTQWVRDRFCEEDILASPELEVLTLEPGSAGERRVSH